MGRVSNDDKTTTGSVAMPGFLFGTERAPVMVYETNFEDSGRNKPLTLDREAGVWER